MKRNGTYQFKAEQWLPVKINKAWQFFSSPQNLRHITPDGLDLRILSPVGDHIYNGMQIDYSVRPFFNISVRWRTEINNVIEENTFVDRQLKGPYSLWEHTHRFIEKDGGVLISDEVNYRLPFGILGVLIHQLIVRKKIESIFEYRRLTIKEIFSE